MEIGEVSVAVAVASPHRKEAFEACHYAMNRLKQIVPIWKREVWADGEEEWVKPDPVFFQVGCLSLTFESLGAEKDQKMDMKLRVLAAIGVMIVGIFIIGCGGDNEEEDSAAPTVEKEPEPTFGLDGDTYRNRRLFKVSDLPVDDWTIKEVTKAVEGEKGEHLFDWLPLPLSLYHTTYTRGEDFFLRAGI